MSNKSLTILGVVAVIMAVLAFSQSKLGKAPINSVSAGSYLIQGLEPDTISSITVRAAGNDTTLVRDGSRFVLPQKGNYPALNSQVNKLVTDCLDIQTAEVVSKDKANHGDLGVKDANAQTTVTFYKGDKSVLTGVVLGNRTKDSQGQYVRLLNDDQTFLSTNAPGIQTAAIDFVEKEIIKADRGNIEKVEVKTPDSKFTLRPAGDKAVVEGLTAPKGKQIKMDTIDSSFAAVTNVSCEDVEPAAQLKQLDFNKTITAYLKDSTVYTIQLCNSGGKSYIKCSAEFTDKSQVMKDQSVESPEQLKAKEAKLLARDKATEFTNKHQGWVYEIAQWKAKNLAPENDDLFENEPNKAPDPNKPAAADPNAAK